MRTECNLCNSNEIIVWFKISSGPFYRSENKRREIYSIARCNSCGLVFVKDKVSSEELDEIYSKGYFTGRDQVGYQDYEGKQIWGRFLLLVAQSPPRIKNVLQKPRRLQRLWNSMHSFARSSQKRFDGLANLVGTHTKEPGKLLDVGCATGIFLDCARKTGWDVKGIEVSKWASERARYRLHLDVLTRTIGDAVKNNWVKNNSFDVVTLWDTIEHLQDPTSVLMEVNSVLKEGGLLFIETLNIDSAIAKEQGKEWHFFRPPKHLVYYSEKTLKEFLEKTGFTLFLDDDFKKDVVIVEARKDPNAPK